MTRRTGWAIGGGAAVVLAGAALWILWQGSTAPPSERPTPTAVATTSAPAADRAQGELDAVLTACAESTESVPPEHCGISIPWGTEFAAVSGIRYRVEKLPMLELDGDSFTAGGGVLVATVTGTGQDGSPRTETYRTENWAVRGDVEISPEKVEIDIW
ncbi:MAG: hypothetical protein JF592_17740 [Microbacterium sp.]|uniref:hypothetical protein n=1 Tax=Microbacterium sp. TaxID=51671 RepID=UPI001E0E490D|nr:hypothetical protein [Microbacterium sp.]MBW8764392.1 hypothetical protein [Microbacterium sp.]